MLIAQQIHDAVRALRFPASFDVPGSSFRVSLGVGSYAGVSDGRPQAWVHASMACTKAKMRGGDRVFLGDYELEPRELM